MNCPLCNKVINLSENGIYLCVCELSNGKPTTYMRNSKNDEVIISDGDLTYVDHPQNDNYEIFEPTTGNRRYGSPIPKSDSDKYVMLKRWRRLWGFS